MSQLFMLILKVGVVQGNVGFEILDLKRDLQRFTSLIIIVRDYLKIYD